jgi:hypothetical protein
VVRKKLRKMQKWRKKVKLRLSGGSSARARLQKRTDIFHSKQIDITLFGR